MKMNKLLLGLLALSLGLFVADRFSVPASAYTDALATQFPGDVEVTDLKVSGSDIVDSAETTRISIGATNAITGNVTISGTLVTTGAQTQTGDINVDGNMTTTGDDVDISTHVVVTGNLTVNGGTNTFGNAVTDIFTFTGLPGLPSNAAPRTNITPTAIGQLIVNTGATPDEVCVSSGTTATTWTRIHDFATACSN